MSTLERIVPADLHPDDALSQDSLKLHLQRYDFAKTHLLPGSILDIACGVGYGTDILHSAFNGKYVTTGVDISKTAIKYAVDHYAAENLHFIESDIDQFFSKNNEFSNIVSLETIEHLQNPQKVIELFYKSLTANG